MTRLTADERTAIQAEIAAARAEAAACMAEVDRLQAMLDAQPEGSDGDTIRMLQPLCACGLPRDHRTPSTGEPRPCADETARIALDESRSRPPVPDSVTRDVSRSIVNREQAARAAMVERPDLVDDRDNEAFEGWGPGL